MTTIGVLGIQGAVREHINSLEKIDEVKAIKVRTLEELNSIDGLIIPGGESTAIGKLLNDFNLMKPLKERIENGMPVWGTCAGMILLAKEIDNDSRRHISAMDIEVMRNGYGSQLDSFSTEIKIDEVSKNPVKLVFIRAPYVKKVWGDTKVLAKIDDKIVACREKNMLATAFHPELTKDTSFHEYFVNMVKEK